MRPIRPSSEVAAAAGEVLDQVATQASIAFVIYCTMIDPASGEPTEGAHIGSGVYVSIGGMPFIFTAAHVIEPARVPGASLVIAGPREIRVGHFTARVTPETTIADTCVIEVPPDLDALLREDGYVPVTRAAIDPRFPQYPWPPEKLHHILCPVGFPAARVQVVGERARPLRNLMTLVPRGTEGLQRREAFEPAVEFFLRYPPVIEGVPTMFTGDGETAEGYDPNGYSGCGIWSLPVDRFLAWQPSDVRLVGLARGYHEDLNLMSATKVWVALDLATRWHSLFTPLTQSLAIATARNPILVPSAIPDDELVRLLGSQYLDPRHRSCSGW